MKVGSKNRLMTRMVALLLTVVLAVGLLPVGALAQSPDPMPVTVAESTSERATASDAPTVEESVEPESGSAPSEVTTSDVQSNAASQSMETASSFVAESASSVASSLPAGSNAPMQDEAVVSSSNAQPESAVTGDIEPQMALARTRSLGDVPEGETAVGQVYVSIEDTVSKQSEDDLEPRGVMAEGWVDLYPSDSTMSVIVRLAEENDLTVAGADTGYITSIGGLGEMDRGPMSGWMGTLNDWFTNEGFGAFTVAAGKLTPNDKVAIMYTLNYGEDIGSFWSNNDKTIKALATDTGTLSPAFSKDVHEYTLVLPEGASSVRLTPTASNKNFQVRASTGDEEYKRTQDIPVENGTVITVKCGDPAWPSMNNQAGGTGASIPAEVYTITVRVGDATVNMAPTVVGPQETEDTAVAGVSYEVALAEHFIDADGDELSYTVSVDGGEAVAVESIYSYTPVEAGTSTLRFEASDGQAQAVYTVSLTVLGLKTDDLVQNGLLTDDATGSEWKLAFENLFDKNEKRRARYVYATVGKSTEAVTFRFGLPAGVEISYEGTTLQPETDGRYTIAVAVTADADEEIFAPDAIMGTGGQAIEFTLMAAGEEERYRINLLRREEAEIGGSIRVTDYLCIGSQYTNKASYGMAPERTLAGGLLSLGNFGGYIVYEFDEPITNDPSNPYGVDFMIYGNSMGAGFSEPGNVLVSNDGKTWYALAGSDYFDDNTLWNHSVTYSTGENKKINWTDSLGNSGTMTLGEHPPLRSNYPLADFDPDQPITMTGARLLSAAKDDYGTNAAAFPDWGYVDAQPNGTKEQAANPYAKVSGSGDGFDLTWAVDAAGNPVKLDSVKYVKVQTASLVDGGAIGEKSTELCGIYVATPGAASAGVTAAPSVITLNGEPVTITENGGTVTAQVAEGALEIAVTAPGDANVYINNIRGAARTYETQPEKGIVRVIVQEGEEAPYICYIHLEEKSDPVLEDIKQAVEGVSLSGVTGLYVREIDWDEDYNDVPVTNVEQTWQLRMKRTDIAVSVVESGNANIGADGTVTFTDEKIQGNVKFRFTKDGVSYDKETLVTVSVHIKTVQEQIDALAAMFATDEGFALIKGENANRDIVKHPLKLVKSPGSYGLAGYSDVELIWTSSNTDIIAPPSYGSSSVKVNRPENGQPDADVILTVTVKKGQYADGSGTAKTAEIQLTVPAVTDEELAETKAAVDKALASITLEGFTESGSLNQAVIDPLALDFDVQLKSVTDLIAAGMLEDTTVNRAMKWEWSTDGVEADGNYLKINYLKCNVMRTAGVPDKDTNLILTLTYNGYSASKTFPVTIKALTEQEITAANAEMREYEAALWEGLKGKNTDRDFVTYDLGWDRENDHVAFYRMHKENGQIVYTLKNSSCPANIGVELDSWKSSEPTVIGHTTGGYGSVDILQLLKRPNFGEADYSVTLSSNMTSLRYKNAKNADGTPVVPDITAQLALTVPAYTNTLAELTVEGVEFTFDPEKEAFAVELPQDAVQVKITAVARDNAARVTVNGQEPDENGNVTLAFSGDKLELPVDVTVQEHTRTVRLTVTRAASAGVSEIYEQTGKWLAENVKNPVVASTGGEWAVIGLARAGYPVDSGYYDRYIANVMNRLEETGGVLDKRKYTEYSRVVLALTAVGYDVTNVAGYNLLEPLADYDQVVWQGINGPIWALLAFDSHAYVIPSAPAGSKTQTTRSRLIDTILNAELAGGGWSLYGGADTDITAMALQALAPYYTSDVKVKAAVDRALACLSGMQNEEGGFGSWGSMNSESCAQVLVALTSLNINPETDSRFVKNGNTVLDALCSFAVEDGGFKHTATGERNGMATEQGYYALAAYHRYRQGATPLYDMSDISIDAPYQAVIRLIDAIGTVSLSSADTISASRMAYDALSETQKQMVGNYDKLTEAEKRLAELQQPVKNVEGKINAIGEVTLESGLALNAARAAYDALSDMEKAYVSNYVVLTRAEKRFAQIKNASAVEQLINAIGSVTQNSEAAIRAARSAYNALTAEEKALVENYASLTQAERAYKELMDKKPQGVTKSIGPDQAAIKLNGVEYIVSKQAAKVMRAITSMPLGKNYDAAAVLEAYRLYDALTDKQKAEVINYDDLEAQMNRMAVDNHQDETTGLKAEGLEWYVKVTVNSVKQGEDIYESFADSIGGGQLLQMLELVLTDLLTGETYILADNIVLRLPAPNLADYNSVVVAQYIDKGQPDYLDCVLEGGELVWETSHSAYYGIVGSSAESSLVLEEDSSESAPAVQADTTVPVAHNSPAVWLWIAVICVGCAVFVFAFLAKKGVFQNRKK